MNNTIQEFAGQIDEVRIWSDVRTQTEILENMNVSLKGNEANLVAYYDFNGTTGNKLLDLSTNNLHGTLVNMENTDWVSSDAWLSAKINNATGYIMMASPVSTTYSDVLDEVWTQGSTGSDAPSLGANYRNIWTWNSSSTTNANTNWIDVDDMGTTLGAGQGFLYYHYNDDNYDATPNTVATRLYVSGAENYNPSLSINSNASGWTLVGNPFASSIDWANRASSSNIQTTAYIWDDGTDAWILTSTNSIIAPFQSFFVQTAVSGSPSLSIGESAKVAGSTFLGKKVEYPILSFKVEQNGKSDRLNFMVNGDASFIHDVHDAVKLSPLSTDFISISTVMEDENYAQLAFPQTDDELEFSIEVMGTSAGDFKLSIDKFTIPNGYEVLLIDEKTGISFEVTPTFELMGQVFTQKKSRSESDVLERGMVYSETADVSYTLKIKSRTTTSAESLIPNKTELLQNYPNPFNPSTTITYSLQKSANVQLNIYDVLGRMITQLESGLKSAGMHQVSWNASSQTSGLYFYQLIVDGRSLAPIKMILIK